MFKRNITSDFVSVCFNYFNYIFNSLKVCRKYSRRKGTVFKPSFKCLKNEKITFSQVILKPECLFYQNTHILFHLILKFVERFRLKQKKKVYK